MSALSRHRPLLQVLAALLLLPWVLAAAGFTPATATDVVIFAIAALGLNLLVGHTGLTSFGHGAFFGIGAYAAALAQRHWFEGGFVAPLLFALAFSAALSLAVGALILRRRGVYFSLLTLAFSALTFSIAFRWTALTGGENGLGNVQRPALGLLDLDDARVFLGVVSAVGLAAVAAMAALLRSNFGHLLHAVRENEQRAQFQGFHTQHAKLGAFVVSATVTGLAGALLAFHHRFASAEPTAVAFSGELLAMVVIGGMRSLPGPLLGALFYVLFREALSMWTPNWLLYFGLAFVAFILFSPGGLVGLWQVVQARQRAWRGVPPASEAAAMSLRRVHAGLPLPGFLRPEGRRARLEVEGIARRFGGVQAVRSLSLVAEGGIHALIGPNGAGKTTAFNLVSGLHAPDSGRIRLDGRELAGAAPHTICRAGLARSFQITNLFKGETVYENIRLSVQARHAGAAAPWHAVAAQAEVHGQTRQLLHFLGLEGMEQALAGELSYGGQRLVDLGIALASRPRVLLLDEPLAGLAAAERERVAQLIEAVAQWLPVLLVEHDIDRVLAMSQHITVMADGALLRAGTPAEIRADAQVQAVYTGSGTPPLLPREPREPCAEAGPPLLELDAVDACYGKSRILHRASLQVRRGEILALLGRNGAGKSTLLKCLVGLVPASEGRIALQGRALQGLPAPDIARLGVGYVPQGRGLFAGMTVAENLALGRLARQQDGSTWSDEKIFEFFPRVRERLQQPADLLSGGEQQMVAVARALAANVHLLLLDEPFEGLAPAVTQELFKVFDRLRREIAIVIVEHNLDLVLALADRACVLERGSVVHEGPALPLLQDLDYRKQVLWL